MTQYSISTHAEISARRSTRWWQVYWLVTLLCGCLFALFLANKLYPLPVKLLQVEESFRVYDREQQPLRLYTTSDGYWRFKADSHAVAPEFLEMLIRFEDKRFWQHNGVDYVAMSRAVGQRLSSGRVLSGASTISMQLARLIEPKPRTVGNKVREIFRAWQIEWYLSKREILDLYLTYAPYGGNIQGVEAASWFYFGIPARDLTVSQSALLVSLPQNPERLRPDRYANRAKQRRDINLARLTEQQILDAESLSLALAEPLPANRSATPQWAEHESAYQRQFAERQGLGSQVRSTINRALQQQVEILASSLQPTLPSGSTVSIAIADRRKMELMAYVGTGDFAATYFAGQSDMLRAIRSPGSTLKPAIYAMAMSDGWLHPKTIISDSRQTYSGYVPENFDGEFGGQMTIAEALMYSRNAPAIKVLHRLGAEQFATSLQRQGIRFVLPKGQRFKKATLPIAVGGVGITMEDLLVLYGCLANQGLCQPLHTVLPKSTPSVDVERWINPESAWGINQVLLKMPRAVAEDRSLSRDQWEMPKIAYKTGTSYGYRDAWAIGYDDNWVIAVWIGRPDGGFQPTVMGLDAAVPILFSAFDIASRQMFTQDVMVSDTAVPLTPFSLRLAGQMTHEELTSLFAGNPPPALAFFDRSWVNPSVGSHPQIFYPLEDSQIMLAGNDAPTHRQSINMQFEAHHYPAQVMLNDRWLGTLPALPQDRSGRREMPLLIKASGAYTLKVIDAEGQSALVSFWVDKAE